MIRLPPGCTINYEIILVLNDLPTEFLQWWESIGGEVGVNSYYNARGTEVSIPIIRYKAGRWSHKMTGNYEYLIRFRSEDANVALMLLMKWDRLVISHNMKEVEKYVY